MIYVFENREMILVWQIWHLSVKSINMSGAELFLTTLDLWFKSDFLILQWFDVLFLLAFLMIHSKEWPDSSKELSDSYGKYYF